MNIYLSDRRIQLIEKKPEFTGEHRLQVMFESKKQLDSVFQDFMIHPEISELTIWSEAEFDKLCRKFISLFTRIDAAGGLVENENKSLLFIYRFEHWDLPKGKIEKRKKESARKAAIREVKEETGLKSVNITGELPSTWHIYTHKQKTILKCTYWFNMLADSSQILQPQEDEGISSIKWIGRQDLDTIIPKTYASLRELIYQR